MNLPLEKQVCGLEISKRLKELKVPQESLFYFWVNRYGKKTTPSPLIENHSPRNPKEGWLWYSAFTVAELWSKLPSHVKATGTKVEYSLRIDKRPNGDSWVSYGAEEIVQLDENMANALGEMLIYLLENSLIKVPK